LVKSASRVVLYIFRFPMWHPSSCRNIGNYKINFNKKKAAPPFFDRLDNGFVGRGFCSPTIN
jgi:hypothetical protein